MPSKDFWIITVLTVIMNGMGVAAYIRHRKIGTPRLRKADLKYGLLGWIPVWTMAWLFSVTGSRVLAIVFLYTISFSCCLFPRYAKIFMEELPKIPELRDQENYLWRIKDAAESPLFWRFFSLVFFSVGTIILYEIWTGVR